MSGTPEQKIADAIRELCNESGRSKVWVNELYKKCGGLEFARPRDFEQMLVEMFALGIIECAAATMNLGSSGERDRITEIRLNWKRTPQIEPQSAK